MSYYIATTTRRPFDEAISAVTDALAAEGFGVLTDIDVKATMKQKLDVEFRNYRILGACNPPFAHRALSAEDKIGTMLPCNVIVQERDDGAVEVAAVNPAQSMQVVDNGELAPIADEVQKRLHRVIDSLGTG